MNKYSFKSNIKASCLLALSLMHSTPVDAFSNSYQNTGGTVSDAAWSGDTPVLNGNLNVGALEGSGGVSGGAASYSIPIILPPGRAGMQPSVSLNYSSRSGNGIAGVGWSLSAGSSIHRCGSTYAQEGKTKSVTYGTDDKLCLDGQKLIKTSGTYGLSGSQYRTELESFARISLYGTINSTTSWLKVEYKNGHISKYGTNSQTRHKAGGKSQIMSWAIQETQDRSGNTITYNYNNYGNGEYPISAIHYTGTNGSDGDRHIRFYYANRPDVSTSYMVGGKTRQTKRLSKVLTQYKNMDVREYRLNYGGSSLSTNRTLLRDITECAYEGGTARCLLPTKFEWLEAETQYQLEKVNSVTQSQLLGNNYGNRWLYKHLPHADYDGDGVKDWPEKTTDAEGRITGTNPYKKFANCYKPLNSFTLTCLQADFDNDGKTDEFKNESGLLKVKMSTTGLWVSTQINWQGQQTYYSGNPTGSPVSISDFNGDGYQDIAFFHPLINTPELRIYFHTKNMSNPYTDANSYRAALYGTQYLQFGPGSTSVKTITTSIQPQGDMDGNGLQDFIVSNLSSNYPSIPMPTTILLNQGNGFTSRDFTGFYPHDINASISGDFFVDLNGDGLSDWLTVGSNNGISFGDLYFKLNIGTGFETSWKSLGIKLPMRSGSFFNNCIPNPIQGTFCEPFIYQMPIADTFLQMDYNGDGKTELLLTDGIEASVCNKVAQYTGATWKCDGAVYGNYQPSMSNQFQQIASSNIDDNVYKYKAVFFDESANGSITTRVEPTNIIASGTQKVAIDAYGNGLSDIVSVFGCRWDQTYCKWNGASSSVGGANTNSTIDEGVWVMRNKGTAPSSDPYYKPIDMMKKATDALGRSHEWDYRPLGTGDYTSSGSKFYDLTHSYQSNDHKYFHFASSMYAVASQKQSDGIGGMNETRYRYRGTMYNTQGRGFQGFKQIIVDDLSDTDSNKHIRSVSDFHQKFPLSGKLEQTRTCLVASGGEDCNSRPITKSFYKWDLWRNSVYYQRIDDANENFSSQVFDGSTTDYRYWVSPYNQWTNHYQTNSAHGQIMTVSTGLTGLDYQDFTFNSNGCQTYARKIYHESSNANRNESFTNNYYHSADSNNWWLCKPNYSLTTTKAITGRGADYASVESGADIQKQVKTTYVFDNTHRKPKTITTEATQGQGTAAGLHSIVNTVYNSYGLPTSVVSDGEHYTGADMADRNVSTTYTADGYFVNSVTNSKGHVTTTEVDPIHGQATKVTDPNLQETLMTYDAFGRVHSIKLPGEPTQYTAYYWCSGVNGGSAWCLNFPGKQYRVETRQLGSPRHIKYFDGFNRENYSMTHNFDGDHWYYTLNKFNNKGQKTHEATINGGVSSWQYTYYDSYDALGRLTKKRTPQSDRGHLPTTYQYDGFVTNINAGGLLMSRKYNGLGQLVWTKDAAGNYTRYAYDGTGNPITLQDANGNPIYAKYNALGHKEYVDDPNMGKKFFWYNTFGEVEKEKDANLTELTYSYDTLGRMTQRWTNGTRSGYWYWDNGNVANYKGLLRWSYDGPSTANARVKYHYYGKTTGGKLYETQTKYRHNESGSFTDYDILHYVDNNFGRPKGMKYNTTGLTLAYDYNPQGYMSKVKNANGGYVYQEIKDLDNHGKVTRQLMANGVMTQTANYDPATAQMTMIKSQKTSGATRLHELTYSYDDFSNLNMQVMIASNGVSNSEDYQYDSLHRLIQSDRTLNTSGQYDTITYNYDAVGNFTKKSDYANTYTYGVLGKDVRKAGPNAVSRIVRPNGLGSMTYYYDNNGNLKNQLVYNASGVRQTAQEKAITYNEFNKPLTIKKGNITSGFSYGADLMRYKQVKTGATGGTITTYYIDKLLEKEVQGSITKYKHYIGDVAIQTKKNSTWEIGFTHRDRLGSVVTITDHMGNLKEHRSFDPFGKPRKGDFVEPTENTFTSITGLTQTNRTTERGFTDHEHLDDHELIHMNGRAYDYNLGRFLSVDPFIQAPGNSQSMNPYSYIMNNPLAGTDPSGYVAEKEWGANRGFGKMSFDCDRNDCGKIISGISAGGSVGGVTGSNGSDTTQNSYIPTFFSIDEIESPAANLAEPNIDIGNIEPIEFEWSLPNIASTDALDSSTNFLTENYDFIIDSITERVSTINGVTMALLEGTVDFFADFSKEQESIRQSQKNDFTYGSSWKSIQAMQNEGFYLLYKVTTAPVSLVNPFAAVTEVGVDYLYSNGDKATASGLIRHVGSEAAIQVLTGKLTKLSGGDMPARLMWGANGQAMSQSSGFINKTIDKQKE